MYDRIANRNAVRAEQASDLYERLYFEEEDRQRAEWEAVFGDKRPFKPSSDIHRKVARLLDNIKREALEEV